MDSVVKSFDTPILFLVFNRPEVTERVFSEIRKVQPARLFIAADGPRDTKEGEKEKCEKVRKIVSDIDWNCSVETLFREQNLGCGKAVSSAITWFFEQVEMGIILEDDCLPDLSFFYYCETLLNAYANNEEIGMISGRNGLSNWKSEFQYIFSHYAQIWGWATWRRAWKKYDFEMSDYNSDSRKNIAKTFEFDNQQVNAFNKIFDSYFNDPNKGYTWDYQWVYTIVNNNMFCITPTNNLVLNIGFGLDATHTKYETEDTVKSYTITFPLNIVEKPIWDKKFDKKLGISFRWIVNKDFSYFLQRVKNLSHKIKKHIK